MSAETAIAKRVGGVDPLSSGTRRTLVETAVFTSLFLAFGAVAAQLLSFALVARPRAVLAVSEPVATSFSRPDIIDRNGRLLATDLEAPSIYVDPALVLNRDELVEKLATVLPEVDQNELRAALADKTRRFVWVRRGVAPKIAQTVHDLGIPGLSFRSELRRIYPGGTLAGHVLGYVNVDNRGMAGIEKFIDDNGGIDPVHSATLSTRAPVRLSIDIGVEHALAYELRDAVQRYAATAAAGLVLNIKTGEVLASASLPGVDPSRPAEALGDKYIDRITGGTYELGSVFKILTLAMAFDEGIADPGTIVDVREPLKVGRFTVSDFHPADRPLSATEIFTHSSNVGAGMLALKAGPEKMQGFLRKLAVLQPMKSEVSAVALPQAPESWSRARLITVSYGHGLAVAPLQFAAAAATILNNGHPVQPTFLKTFDAAAPDQKAVLTSETSRRIARLMRLNVSGPDGTGKRADVPGYRVGGKTGTADRAGVGGYSSKSVIASFLGAFPMDDPQYLTMVILFDPKGVAETHGQRTAGSNAAPVTGRLIARIAPQLGVAPMTSVATE